ncbi:cyclase family protein [Flavicella sediminum]|uniref:cyclase family protein n=1 Tax=Flavicella sediminum TaxID=2585141 RepID=UPI00111F11B9|nr:cyclase family protein [Flavicella sediminum]
MQIDTGNKIIDLTRSISNGDPGVTISVAKSMEEDGWNASTLQLYSHIGTHMDAPLHFNVSSQTIDEIPVDRLISKAWLVDLSHIKSKGLISINDLGKIAEKVKDGDSLLLKTGWSQFFGTDLYRNELPRLSQEFAEWCVAKKINMIGVEPPSVADVNSIEEVTLIHEILMKGNIIIVEGLVNLDKIKSASVSLIALPLKVKKGDGSPARIIAIER